MRGNPHLLVLLLLFPHGAAPAAGQGRGVSGLLGHCGGARRACCARCCSAAPAVLAAARGARHAGRSAANAGGKVPGVTRAAANVHGAVRSHHCCGRQSPSQLAVCQRILFRWPLRLWGATDRGTRSLTRCGLQCVRPTCQEHGNCTLYILASSREWGPKSRGNRARRRRYSPLLAAELQHGRRSHASATRPGVKLAHDVIHAPAQQLRDLRVLWGGVRGGIHDAKPPSFRHPPPRPP